MIETFSSDLRVAPEGIRSDNLNLVVPAIGSLTGNGTVSAAQALNFAMVAHLSASNSPVGKIVSLGGSGKGGGILQIQGTSSKPGSFRVGAIAVGSVVKGVLGGAPGRRLGAVQNLGKQLGGLFGQKKQ